jgi:multidrug efflux pump subunit AcrA (membrane-fusion protein)
MKNMNKKRLLLSAALVAALLPLSATLNGCAKKHEAAQHQENGVKFDANSRFTIALNNISDVKPIAGVYTSDDEAQARARIGGTLINLLVDEGQNVAQGQLIGIIDEARFGAEVAAGQAGAQSALAAAQAAQSNAAGAPANLEAARAMAAKAQADYNRTKTLYDQGVYAQARLDQMSASLRAANAQVDAASAGVNAALAQANAAQSQAGAAGAQAKVAQAVRAQGRIIAPRAGKVTMVPVPKGSVVMPGEVVAFIAAGAPVLRVRAPESDAKNLKIGQSVSIADAQGNLIGTSTIIKIYPMVENGQIKIDIASDSAEHFIGERVNVLVPIGNRNAVVIPKSYIITRQGVDFVLLLKGETALEVPIQRGQSTNTANIKDGVEILSGLEINDIIVASAK